jgi:phospholipid/cholesterol/gamma-HCH transport system ATP-binding protein
VALDGFEDHLPSEISGGMKKRAGVARALALDPRIVFLDEPSAGLDPITSAELDRLILDLRDALGTTMVVVSHELASIYAVADRCIVLEKRRHTIVARGKPAELRDTSDDPYVRAFFQRKSLSEA